MPALNMLVITILCLLISTTALAKPNTNQDNQKENMAKNNIDKIREEIRTRITRNIEVPVNIKIRNRRQAVTDCVDICETTESLPPGTIRDVTHRECLVGCLTREWETMGGKDWSQNQLQVTVRENTCKSLVCCLIRERETMGGKDWSQPQLEVTVQ
eukprot:Pgem_evm1s19353